VRPGCGERVEPDEQFAVAGLDVAGDGECLADHGVGLVAGAGVVAVQGAGQAGFGVVGGHPDGVGDLLDLGVQLDHVRGQHAERDPGRDGAAAWSASSSSREAASTGAARALISWLDK
jgi:hypothetical protein